MFVSSEGGRATASSVECADGDKDNMSLFRIVKVGDEWKVAEHSTAPQD